MTWNVRVDWTVHVFRRMNTGRSGNMDLSTAVRVPQQGDLIHQHMKTFVYSSGASTYHMSVCMREGLISLHTCSIARRDANSSATSGISFDGMIGICL